MLEDRTITPLAEPRPYVAVHRLHEIEYRGWVCGIVLAVAGIALVGASASHVSVGELYDAGLISCLGALIVIVNTVVLAHIRVLIQSFADAAEHFDELFGGLAAMEKQALSAVNSMAGAAESELQRRREQR